MLSTLHLIHRTRINYINPGWWTSRRVQKAPKGYNIFIFCPPTNRIYNEPCRLWPIKKATKRRKDLQRKPSKPPHRLHSHFLIYGSIFRHSSRHMGLSESSQEILASSSNYYNLTHGSTNYFHPRLSSSALRIFYFLINRQAKWSQ